MLNLRTEKTKGQTLDRMVRCSLDGLTVCNQITYVITDDSSPATLLLSPVFPSLNRSPFPSGFVASSIAFLEVFENVFGEKVDEILCVLETADNTIEFLVKRGH